MIHSHCAHMRPKMHGSIVAQLGCQSSSVLDISPSKMAYCNGSLAARFQKAGPLLGPTNVSETTRDRIPASLKCCIHFYLWAPPRGIPCPRPCGARASRTASVLLCLHTRGCIVKLAEMQGSTLLFACCAVVACFSGCANLAPLAYVSNTRLAHSLTHSLNH